MIFHRGKKMRVIALLCLLGTLPDVAIAQVSQCQSVPKASDRLACYDRAAPTIAVGNPTAPKKNVTAQDKAASKNLNNDQGKTVDMLAAENSKLDAKLKTICRGC
jgi:hypothetical protein